MASLESKMAMSSDFLWKDAHFFNVKIVRFKVRKLHFSLVISNRFLSNKVHHKFEYEHYSKNTSRKHAYIILTPLKPHFYIVKLGFTGLYIIFLISAQNIDCGYP